MASLSVSSKDQGVGEGLFILSLPRTGSTLLRLLLDTHPQIWAPDELELGALCSSLLFTLEGVMESTGGEATSRALEETRRTLSRLLAAPMRDQQADLWCEKSPRNRKHLEVLEKTFPKARWLVLHRHPIDTIASWLDSNRHGILFEFLRPKVSARPSNFLAAMTEAWVEETEKLIAFEARGQGQVMRLRYEDLVAHPAPTATQLFEFLGRGETGRGVVEKVFTSSHHQRTRRGGDINAYFSDRFTTQRIGRGNKIPWQRLASLPEPLEQRLMALLDELGYPRLDFTRPDYEVGFEETSEAPGPTEGKKPSPAIHLAPFFEGVLPGYLEQEKAIQDLGSYLFEVSGERGGLWLVELRQERARVSAATEVDGEGACRVSVSDENLEAILEGRAQAALLFRRGELKVEGEFDTTSLRALQGVLRGAIESSG